jgi:hypothetical protein
MDESKGSRWSWSDRLAIALACLAGILALILLWMDKTPVWAAATIALMAALVVYAVIHFVPSWKARIPALLVAWLLIGVFGWRIWPHNETTSGKTGEVSLVKFVPSDIHLYEGASHVQAGQKISFRFTFKNIGVVSAKDVQIINVASFYRGMPDAPSQAQMIAAIRAAADAQLKAPHAKGPTVDPDYTHYIDGSVDITDGAEVNAIVQGTGRLYEYFQIRWADENGKPGEQEICMYLRKPKSSHLTVDDIKTWDSVYLPPRQQ